jgi:hypothetical protein
VTPVDGSNRKSNADKVLDALRDVIDAGCQELPPDAPDLPENVVAAARHAWRNRFLADAGKREPDAKPGTHDRIFRRAVPELTKTGKVEELDGWFWLKGGRTPDMSGQRDFLSAALFQPRRTTGQPDRGL